MKSVILAILATFISINTFAAKVAVYSIPLTRVEMVQTDSIVSDPVEILASDSDGLIKSQFEDSRIQIIWKCDGTRFKFVLLNKTNLPLTIDWDKIVYVDTNGEAGNVIHSGVKYNERNQGQLKTIVPKLAKATISLFHPEIVFFSAGDTLLSVDGRRHICSHVYTKKIRT